MNKTLETLDDIRYYVKRFQEAYDYEMSLFGEETSQSWIKLVHLVNDAEEDKLISKDIAQEYRTVLEDIRNHNGDYYDNTAERINKLLDINNQQTDDCKNAEGKLSEAFSIKWKNENKQTEDTKKDLQHISDLMRFYENSYSQNGALESVDMLCDIMNGIKNAVENETISESTAKALIKPLEEIKDNLFNDEVQKRKIQEFNDILNAKSSAENKGKQEQNIIDIIKPMQSEKVQEKEQQKKDVIEKSEEKELKNKEQQTKAEDEQESKILEEKFNTIQRLVEQKYRQFASSAERSRLLFPDGDSWHLNGDAADVLEKLYVTGKKVDFKSQDIEDSLQEYALLFNSAISDLGIIYAKLYNLDAAYEELWNDIRFEWQGLADEFLLQVEKYRDTKGVHKSYQRQQSENINKDNKIKNPEPQRDNIEKQDQRNMQQIDIAKKQSDVEKILEDQKLATKENSGSKGNEAQEKALNEQISKNKEQKQDTEKEKNNSHTMDSLKKAIQQYASSVENRSFKDSSKAFVELAGEVNAAEKEGVISKEMANELRAPLKMVQTGAFSYKLHADAVKKLNEIIKNKVQQADVVKTQGGIDKTFEKPKVDVKENSVQKTGQEQLTKNSNIETIRALEKVVGMFDRQHSDESFKNMMVALKDLSEKKVVSEDLVQAYRNVLNDVKKHRNTERGIFDLSTEIYNQIDELKNQDKEKSPNANMFNYMMHGKDQKDSQHKMEAKDIKKEEIHNPVEEKKLEKENRFDYLMKNKDKEKTEKSGIDRKNLVPKFNTGMEKVKTQDQQEKDRRKRLMFAANRWRVGGQNS